MITRILLQAISTGRSSFLVFRKSGARKQVSVYLNRHLLMQKESEKLITMSLDVKCMALCQTCIYNGLNLNNTQSHISVFCFHNCYITLCFRGFPIANWSKALKLPACCPSYLQNDPWVKSSSEAFNASVLRLLCGPWEKIQLWSI